MNHRHRFGLLLVLVLSPCASGVRAMLPLNDSSGLMVQAPIVVTPTAEQTAALEAYVQGRYRRVKATVDHDRDVARSYMTEAQWAAYRDKLHPETAIPQLKQCADCDEFGISILEMHSFKLATPDGSNTNLTELTVRTQPLKPSVAVQDMRIQLVWKPVAAAQGDQPPILIDGDEAHGGAQRIPQGGNDSAAQPVSNVPDPSPSGH